MNLVKDISSMGIKSLAWTGGGEPTQNPNLKEAINFLKSNSTIKMGMFTNGTLLSKFNLFETLVTSLEWIRISIDAGNKNSYDNLRVTNKQNNFDTVIANINELISYKKKLNSKITIGVGFVVTEKNYKEIIEFANLFKNIDVDYCQYKPEIIQVERNGSLNATKQQISSEFWLNEVIDLLNSASEILGKKFECNSYKLEDLMIDKKNYGRGYKECIGSQFQPCVGADGHVYVCTNHRGHKKYSYGNLKEKRFSEIWRDIKKRKEIMDLINNKEKFSKCSQLCKPHESNKILWSIKNNFKNKEFQKDLDNKFKKIKEKLVHPDFI
jgi:radical SAM protein with 4Fe4S-binding SPASM domain